MKKKLFGLSLIATATLLLPACNGGNDIVFWSPFGSGYTTQLNTLIESMNEKNEFHVRVESKGSYPNIQAAITKSLSTHTFPHFALGYPDHFAGYINSQIMVELDEFIEAYDEKHADELQKMGYTSIIDDYYENYMQENKELKYDEVTGDPYVMGIPFNKSTEVLSYNGHMLDYMKSVDETIALPATYGEWLTFGRKVRQILIDDEATKIAGKYLYGAVDADGTASDFLLSATKLDKGDIPAGKELIGDYSLVNATNFRVLSWHDLDNMFITLVRQWGGQYTSYTVQDRKTYKHGWATFWDDVNKEKTLAALETIDELHNAKIFGTGKEMTGDEDDASGPFKDGKLFALVSSSGGLSYNVNKNKARVRIAAIPYYSDQYKFVISQGTNLGLFDQGTDEQLTNAFEAMIQMSTGEIQGTWAATTGYFPASKSAMNSAAYQAFLNTTFSSKEALKRAYKEALTVNNNEYRGEESPWTQFVDPGFVGSSTIRDQVGNVIGDMISRQDGVTIENVVDAIVAKISAYVK